MLRLCVLVAMGAALLAACSSSRTTSPPLTARTTSTTSQVTRSADIPLTADQLLSAVAVLRARFAAQGITAQIYITGEDITVTTSASSTPDVRTLVTPGQLTFREIDASAPGSSTAASAPGSTAGAIPSGPEVAPTGVANKNDEMAPTTAEVAAYEGLECTKNGGRPAVVDADIHHFVAACDRTQDIKYLLKPAQIVGTDVSSASVNLQTSSQGISTGAWVVELTFKDSAISKVESITSRLYADSEAPLAITLDGVVQSAPSTNGVLGKNVEISGGSGGGFSEQEARELATVLKCGQLPAGFNVTITTLPR